MERVTELIGRGAATIQTHEQCLQRPAAGAGR